MRPLLARLVYRLGRIAFDLSVRLALKIDRRAAKQAIVQQAFELSRRTRDAT